MFMESLTTGPELENSQGRELHSALRLYLALDQPLGFETGEYDCGVLAFGQ